MNFFPINLQEEKKKFFFDPDYNPQFIFEEPIPDKVLYGKYGQFGGELAEKALFILNAVIQKWGSESAYLDDVEGATLSREEATSIITEYLKACGLENVVTLHFSKNFIPRTHIDGLKMNIRLPIEYRAGGIRGMLHHEIGTHIFRRINDRKQKWFEKREKYNLHDYLESEEGLAAPHYYLEIKEPYLWTYAVQYYACFLATRSSFAEINNVLKKYVDDRERRFKITLRAKRGVSDTSQPGGFTKDQVYLRGIVKMSKWLQVNDFDITKFYIGKVSLEDLDSAWETNPMYQPVLPPLFTADKVAYKKTMQKILKINGFL